MDPEYDTQWSKTLLGQVLIEATSKEHDGTALNAIQTSDYQVVFIEEPPSWHITKITDGASEAKEATFQVSGILCRSDLPPVRSRDTAKLQKKTMFICQGVHLTGLGIPTFEDAIEKVREFQKTMSAATNDRKFNEWQAASYEGNCAIDASAHYFTPRKHVPHERGLSFETGVDPDGVLAKLRGQGLIHRPDNRVEYLKAYKDSRGRNRKTRIEPKEFSIGDIVTMTVAFVGFGIKDKGAMMTVMLKALTLVEKIAVANTDQIDGRRAYEQANIPKLLGIKHKAIFNDKREASEGMDRMNLSE